MRRADHILHNDDQHLLSPQVLTLDAAFRQDDFRPGSAVER